MDTISPGRYIVAVSGGVDSMVLLDMLQRCPGLDLVVAHADHGMRADAHKDREFVAKYARNHNLVCITTQLHLGSNASEALARQARYDFLLQCREKHNASKIIVAHHQDDVVETAIIAIIRGTGWRGIAPFVGDNLILRPLVNYTKDQLIGYARKHNVPWREDATNTNQHYLRNYVRHSLISMLDQKSNTWRDTFLQHIRTQQRTRNELEKALDSQLQQMQLNGAYSRYAFIMADPHVAYELLQQLFRRTLGNSLQRHQAEAALLFVKVAKPHRVLPLGNAWQLRVTTKQLIVEPRTP